MSYQYHHYRGYQGPYDDYRDRHCGVIGRAVNELLSIPGRIFDALFDNHQDPYYHWPVDHHHHW
ncbi:hypothetical protein [Rhodoligotrophos defluvii]|uniref:hypothetical protein n=1 Tax=Rhodoligotrophos defluvii TaxID=2561934 RepID=UPI0010CA07FE|nr:hypothetical protein [Rhodoligotrophos defluvii]